MAAAPCRRGPRWSGLLRDKTRLPGIPPVAQVKVLAVIARSLRKPQGAVTHWIGHAVAKAMSLSLRIIIQRIWAAHKLQQHRIGTFERSTDPDFVARLSSSDDARCQGTG